MKTLLLVEILIIVVVLGGHVTAFTTELSLPPIVPQKTHKHKNAASSSKLFATAGATSAATAERSRTNVDGGSDGPIDKYIRIPIEDLTNSFPWNARRLEDRRKRKFKRKLTLLHRFLGVRENADWVDLDDATKILIQDAGDDIKRKILIEKSRDDILQIRLNQRLAGYSKVSTEADLATALETEGEDEMDDSEKGKEDEKRVQKPNWMKDLIVRNDEEWKKETIKKFGLLTLFGMLVPSLIFPYGNVCAGYFILSNLLSRGVPSVDNGRGKKVYSMGETTHKRLAFMLTLGIFGGAKLFSIILIPKKLHSFKLWGLAASFVLENFIHGTGVYYLKPCKENK